MPTTLRPQAHAIPLPPAHIAHRVEHRRLRALLVAAAFEEGERMRQLEAANRCR